jgi:hypothetical protein
MPSFCRQLAATEIDLMRRFQPGMTLSLAFSRRAISLLLVWSAASCFDGRPAWAQTLAYSFETDQGGPDGFTANGGGVYAQDTIGATEGPNSMKVELIGFGNTFVGAISSIINPTPAGAIIGDPPGIDHVLFDVTVTEPFVGTFANMGVTVFGCSQDGMCGLKRQFIDEEAVDLPVGTHRDLRIDLALSHETGEPFNQTFGEAGSGSDLIPTHFQFFFNKPATSNLTLYIDNVRIGMTPAAVPGDYNGNGTVDAADYVLWRDGGPLQNEVSDPGTVSGADYDAWRARFGNPSAGSGGSLGAVPEPAAGLTLLFVAGACVLATRRGHAIR